MNSICRFLRPGPSLLAKRNAPKHASHTLLRNPLRWVFAFLLFALSVSCGLAQSTGQGSISGTVTDSAGAVIQDAQVKIVNSATNVAFDSASNGRGYFEVDNLNPGVYTIEITVAGFERMVRQGITLSTGARLNIQFGLKPGQATETITVTADASLLNTESGSAGQVLTTRQIQTLPVSGSNPAWLINMAPGVQSSYSQVYSLNGTLNWNGVSHFGANGVTYDNEYSLDGAPNMQGRNNGINPTPDELGEMKMDITGYDASVGHTMGVSVTQTTRSGANQFHGSVRESYSDLRWAAMSHFQGLTYKYEEAISGCNGSHSSATCLELENQYGWPGVHENNGAASLGGPVLIPRVFNGRNKLFFFVSILDDVYAGSGSGTISIPTVRERSGDFSDLPTQTTNLPAEWQAGGMCSAYPYYGQYQVYDPFSVSLDAKGVPRRKPFCGNVLPSNRLTNSAMTKIYNQLLPTPTATSPLGSNYTYTTTKPQTYRTYTGRGDYALSESDHLFIRYTRADYTNSTSGFTAGNVDQQAGPRWIDTAALGWSHIFNTKTSLDVTIGGNNYRTHCCYYPGYDQYQPTSIGLPSYASTYAGSPSTLPILSVSSYQQIGQADNSTQIFRALAFRGNLTRVQGSHTIRAGGEFRIQHVAQGAQGNLAGTYSFNNSYTQENNGSDSTYTQSNWGLSYASFLMGVQSTASVGYTPPYSISSPYYGFYAGDTWRVTPKLTVVPGIRFEYEAGVTEAQNRQIVGWDFNAALPIASAANTAYQAVLAGVNTTQLAALPTSLSIQGGPLYAGANGASNRNWKDSYRVLPRVAAAYQLNHQTVLRVGYGLFFDTLNAEMASLNQGGYSASTSVPSSTVFGTNFVPGGSPLVTDPFPANATGQRFTQPVGNAAGAMYYAGSSATVNDHDLLPARQQRGQIGVQRQFGEATMLEVDYIAALTTNITLGQNYTYAPPQFYSAGLQPNTASNSLLTQQVTNPFALANFSSLSGSNAAAYQLMSLNSFFTQAKTSLSSLVHLNPQMTGLTINRSIGETKFQELLVHATRRMSHGLSLMGSVQFSHQMDRDYFANAFDPSPSWEYSNTSVPVRVTTEGVYDLPFGKGHRFAPSGWQSAILGGFQFDALYEAQPGQLISFGNLFYVGDIKASNIKISHPTYVNNLTTGGYNYVQWLNPGNVVATPYTTTSATGITTTSCTYTGTGFVTNPTCQPTGYNLRAFPTRLKGVRQMGLNGASMNLQKSFRIREGVGFSARFESYNVFNHQVLNAPNTSVTNSQFGQVTAQSTGQGNGNARWINISGRLQF